MARGNGSITLVGCDAPKNLLPHVCHSWDQKGVDEETAGRLTLCIIRSLNDDFDILVYVVGMFSILY